MIPIFTDASSAILLEKIELFKPLLKVFKLVMPRSVFYEITKPGYPGADAFTAAFRMNRYEVEPGSESKLAGACPVTANLDKGEKDTICLFLEYKKGFILIDDGKAAQWCVKHDLPFINALLVPKIFWYAGLMTENECLNKMKALCRIGRYAEKVRDFAFDCTLNDVSFFLPEQKNVK